MYRINNKDETTDLLVLTHTEDRKKWLFKKRGLEYYSKEYSDYGKISLVSYVNVGNSFDELRGKPRYHKIIIDNGLPISQHSIRDILYPILKPTRRKGLVGFIDRVLSREFYQEIEYFD